nr:hypothetical protein [Actinomycetota bacterium]
MSSSDRIVLGRIDTATFVGFQWTGAEPESLNDPEEAVALGATWEGDELVTYNLRELTHALIHEPDGYMEDPD